MNLHSRLAAVVVVPIVVGLGSPSPAPALAPRPTAAAPAEQAPGPALAPLPGGAGAGRSTELGRWVASAVDSRSARTGPAVLRATSTEVGTTWARQPAGTNNSLWGISCPSPKLCLVVGDKGTVLVSTDGGATWQGQPSGTTDDLAGIACPTRTYLPGGRQPRHCPGDI